MKAKLKKLGLKFFNCLMSDMCDELICDNGKVELSPWESFMFGKKVLPKNEHFRLIEYSPEIESRVTRYFGKVAAADIKALLGNAAERPPLFFVVPMSKSEKPHKFWTDVMVGLKLGMEIREASEYARKQNEPTA